MNLKKRTVIVSGSNMLITLSNLVLSVGLAWALTSKEDYGMIQQILMIISFCYSIVSGFSTGLSYFYGNYSSTRNRLNLYRKLFNSLLIVSISICIVIFVFESQIAINFKNSVISKSILAFIFLLLFRMLSSFFLNFFVVTNNEVKYFITNAFFLLANFFLIILLLNQNKSQFGLSSILYSLTAIELIRLFIYSIFFRKYYIVGQKSFINKLELYYILSITGVTVLNTFYVFVDKYMISYMLEPEDYANYQVGAFIVPFIGIVSGSIMTSIMPVLSRLKKENKLEEICAKLKNATKYTSLILIPIFVFFLIFGKYLIIAIYSDKYLFSGEIFQVYCLRYFTGVILFSVTMASIGLQKWVLVTSSFSLILNIILNYFLIGTYGVMGAVYATVITGYIGVLLPIILLNKNLKANFLNYFPLKEYIITLIISLVICIIIYFFSFYMYDYSSYTVFPISIIYYFLVLVAINKIFNLINVKNTLKIIFIYVKGK